MDTLTKEMGQLKEEYHILQQKYQTMLTVCLGYIYWEYMTKLLQMYGEKVEEAEELKLDLQDVKEMYKMQIDQLTNFSKSD